MPLTRGQAVGYDAVLMVFKFTMRNGEQTVQCEISKAALGDLADRGSGAMRDPGAEFEAHRDLIESMTSEQFDQKSSSNQFDSISKNETPLVRIFSKHIAAQRKVKLIHISTKTRDLDTQHAAVLIVDDPHARFAGRSKK